MKHLLLMRNITKRFGKTIANEKVTLSVNKGEILGLLGENGAGKSTLMNILYGLVKQDGGEILCKGEPITISSPRDAIRNNIGMIHQHFMLIPPHTVLENIILGQRRGKFTLNLSDRKKEVQEAAERFGFTVDLDKRIADLSVGQRQRIEIFKALYRGADILILDEPTSVLAPQEVDELFLSMRRLREEGKSCIFISHKLDEVLDVCDRIAVMSKGRLVQALEREHANRDLLVQLMLGREMVKQNINNRVLGDKPLEIKNLCISGNNTKLDCIRGIDLHVREGEILGIGGVDGNGQLELAEAIAGLRTPTTGKIIVDGQDMTGKTAVDFLKAGVAYIPSNRQERAAFLSMDIMQNLMMKEIVSRRCTKMGLLDYRWMKSKTIELINDFDIRAASPTVKFSSLSGGNQQKVVLARELLNQPRVLIASQPTRGLDVGAMQYVRNRIIQAAREGAAVVLISTEIEELLKISDRIAILFRGTVMGEFPADTPPDLMDIGHMMTGTMYVPAVDLLD